MLRVITFHASSHHVSCFESSHFILRVITFHTSSHHIACFESSHFMLRVITFHTSSHHISCFEPSHFMLRVIIFHASSHHISCFESSYFMLRVITFHASSHHISCFESSHFQAVYSEMFFIGPIIFQLQILIIILALLRINPSFICTDQVYGWSHWQSGLRRGSAAVLFLGLWVRIPPVVWMSVCCECDVLSGRGLCDELITRPEEFYRLWCVWVWSCILNREEP